MKKEITHFTIHLILPEAFNPTGKDITLANPYTTELADDNNELPAVIFELCQIFSKHGIKFHINGFFSDPLPLDTLTDLQYFLEDLPGFIMFLRESNSAPYNIGLWGQGIETEFFFTRLPENNLIEIKCLSHTCRAVRSEKERLPVGEIVQQVLNFVANYRIAVTRLCPGTMKHPWNKTLFTLANQLQANPMKRNDGNQ